MELYPCNCPAEGPFERTLSRSLSRRSEGKKEYSRLPFHSQKPGSSLCLGKTRHALHMCYMHRKDLATQKTYFLPKTGPQQSMTNKATTASLCYLHPSFHWQNQNIKYIKSLFLFLVFCYCLLWQQPLSWGQQEKRIH